MAIIINMLRDNILILTIISEQKKKIIKVDDSLHILQHCKGGPRPEASAQIFECSSDHISFYVWQSIYLYLVVSLLQSFV